MRSLITLLIALLLTGCERPAPPPSPFQAIDVSWRYDEKPADFRLTEPSGKVLKLSDFKDKVVVLFLAIPTARKFVQLRWPTLHRQCDC